MWIRYTLASIFLALAVLTVEGQSQRFTPTQVAILNKLYFQQESNSISGTFLTDETVEIEKLGFFVVTNELDPVFIASVAFRITSADTNKWHTTDLKVAAHTNVLDSLASDIADITSTSAASEALAATNSYYISILNTNTLFQSSTSTPQWVTNEFAYSDEVGNPATNVFIYWGVP